MYLSIKKPGAFGGCLTNIVCIIQKRNLITNPKDES